MAKLQNISTDSNRKSLPTKSKSRRLTSFDELRNDTENDHDIDIEQDIVVTPTTSTSDQAKSTTNGNVFKVPEIPQRISVRKSKANNSKTNKKTQTNDSNANENAIPSTSRQMSQDEFDFQIDIEPLNDDELEPYMPQDDTTLPTLSVTNTSKSSSKNKESKSKSSINVDSKTKPKRARNTVDTDLRTMPRRTTSRDSFRNACLQGYFNSFAPSKSNKQKHKKTNTAPVIPVTHRRVENGPPKKKLRTEPETRRKTTQPMSSKSLKTSTKSTISSKSKPDQPSSSSSTATSSSKDELADFMVGLDEKRMMRQDFWKDINDFKKDNEIQQEDITYIKTKDGIIGK